MIEIYLFNECVFDLYKIGNAHDLSILVFSNQSIFDLNFSSSDYAPKTPTVKADFLAS